VDFWKLIEAITRTSDQRFREMKRSAFAPQLPPAGLATGKKVIPRARANLPAGVLDREVESDA